MMSSDPFEAFCHTCAPRFPLLSAGFPMFFPTFLRRPASMRLFAVLALLFAGMAAIVSAEMLRYRSNILEERQEKCRSQVENVHRLIQFYYDKVSTEHLPAAAAQGFAIEAIRQLHAHPDEYFWIMDATTGKLIMHASLPSLEGIDTLTFKDKNGTYLFQNMLQTARQSGEGFVNYVWSKPGESQDTVYAKTSYVKLFAPWNWIVGSGLYVDDVDNDYWHSIYLYTSLGLAFFIFCLALGLTFSEGAKKEKP